MMKIRTAITVMSPIMSKDKKAFLIYYQYLDILPEIVL